LIFILRHFDSSWVISGPKFMFLIGIAYIFQNYKQRISILSPIVLTVFSLIFLFYKQNTFISLSIDQNVIIYFKYWPVVALIIGLFIIIKKR
jgi:hypothetical protein